ncbi:sulfotransferase domain-containing protein [Clostridium sp. AWRP]|uniref:sulfotransferase domain-containing protein n=1 Tax=Clostridium sp. AWRP TaxID=2212991 RepID=UPI000FD6E3DB|nr:sulfotransferase domain-containing protein [Clostridium sp. AWRP]AZV56473.1 sulfotransferase domain-containing protein [Clostridium sp. AWRP]
MNNIIWLASYPKSGNTWFRTFISNLLSKKEEIVTINQLKTDGIFSSREVLDNMIGVESSNLTFNEIDRLRPVVYKHLSENLKRNLYIKVHDAYTYLEDGTPLIGTINSKVIYIMRNPLDVAVSFANHSTKDLDTVIRNMGDKNFAFCDNRNKLGNQLKQKLLTWSMHVESFEKAHQIPVHIVKYEDMKLEPIKIFKEAVKFIGLDYNEKQINEAILKSNFKKLKEDEEKNGFKEKPSKVKSFFRRGEIGDWKNHLTEKQIKKLIEDHREVMIRFGYIDGSGKLVY